MIHGIKETTPGNVRTFNLIGVTGEEMKIIIKALRAFSREATKEEDSKFLIRVADSLHDACTAAFRDPVPQGRDREAQLNSESNTMSILMGR